MPQKENLENFPWDRKVGAGQIIFGGPFKFCREKYRTRGADLLFWVGGQLGSNRAGITQTVG